MIRIKGVVFDAYGTLFDVFSVAQKCERKYPGKGMQISQIWRQKQLEYSWLRTLMNSYKNFWEISKESLCYALEEIGLQYNQEQIENIMDSYLCLSTYPEVSEALQEFRSYKLMILTNGNFEMINPLLIHTGLNKRINEVLSADTVKLFKPRDEVYQLVVDHYKVSKAEIMFVSSNAWDAAGAKSFGFTVGWINRLDKPTEKLGFQPDYIVSNLLELAQKIRGELKI
ncbi:MAG: haloacid dehalogenase type II [Ethanoligenens sp.]